MPISNEPNKTIYYTDGTIQEFSFRFKFFNTSDIKVSFWTEGEGVYLEENKDYEIEYTDKEGGSVVLLGYRGANGYPATPHPGTLLISRIMPLDQQANIRPVSGFPEEVITSTFDKLVMIDQQQEEELQRCLKLPSTSLVSGLTLPEPEEGKTLFWEQNHLRNSDISIDKMSDFVNTAVVSANTATEKAGVAFQKANESSDSAILAEKWATKLDDKVDGIEYSAKHYAQLASDTVQGSLSDIEMARVDSIESIQDRTISSVKQIETTRDTAIGGISAEEADAIARVKAEGTTQKNSLLGYVDKAKDWAVSDSIVENGLRSAKYYAQLASDTVQGSLSDIEMARVDSIESIQNQTNTAIDGISAEEYDAITRVKAEGTTQKNSLQVYVNKAKDWAVSDSIVENGLRSAKYYAQHAQGLSDVTYEHLRASRAYEDKGAVLSDEEGFATVRKYKHSTFDLSKFTVVGSPNITSDGVASGLNKTNYITLPSIDVNALKWNLQGRIKPTLTPNSTFYITNLYLNVRGFTLYRDVTGGIVIDIVINVDNVETRFKINTPVHWELGKAYDFFIQRNNGIFSFGSKEENELDYTVRQSEDKGNYPLADGTINLMQSYDTNDAEFDLKQFSITVDGKEVFNGNKTGLDVIKEDNYTVVGSPTISEDGVASGFSNSDYVYSNIFVASNTTKIRFAFTYKTNESQQVWLRLVGATADNNLTNFEYGIFSRLGNMYIRATINGTNNTYFYATNTLSKNWTDGDLIECEFNLSLSKFTGSISNTTKSTSANVNYTYSVDELSFNRANIGGTGAVSSIDLNSFKIYVDGNLVYQPCLKIPYTESKTGSKIVDAIYRGRVQDVYEQYGQAKYYTLDEENKNFTLPMGEIYGMMGQRALISSTVTDTSRVDIYSDKTCLICGNVTTSGTINLPIELANSNYFTTLPASAKTSTSFTTTSTGDYILIGKVV